MTPAQRRRLRHLAAHADTGPGFECLVAWVESYAERARGALDLPTDAAAMPVWDRLAKLLRRGWH